MEKHQRQHNPQADHSQAPITPLTTTLDIVEAKAILGLSEGVLSRDRIIEAHRALIQRVHPDRGGSDHLAAKVNQAKAFLLEYL